MMDSRVIDLTGKRIGNLVVIDYAGSVKQRSHWMCKCDCGTVWKVASNNLGKTKTSRCGKCAILPVEEALSRRIYADYKNRSTKKSQEFLLSLELFKKLIFSDCSYCGESGSNVKRVRNRKVKYNGIDRIDSSKGYIVGNVQTCCKSCNSMKMDMPIRDFLTQIEKIYKFSRRLSK